MHYDLGTPVGGFKRESGAGFLVLRNNAMTSFHSVIDACKKNRAIRLTQCCTQFKSPSDKILCVLYLHYNVAFTVK